MKIVQQPGGTTQESDEYVGPPRQITVDTTRSEFRLHDGVTPGGIRIPNLDYLLTVFKSSGEDPLSGGLPESGTGIVVRIGDGEYTLREIAVAENGGLVIVHGSGVGGNPTLTLDEIPAQRLFGNLGDSSAIPVALEAAEVWEFLQQFVPTQEEAEGWSDDEPKMWSPELDKQAHEANDPFTARFLHVQDQKNSGTNGGTFTASSAQLRTLNTVVINEITGASLGSNRITLPAGTYYIDASAPALWTDSHKAKLRNFTDSVDILPGTTETNTNSGGGQGAMTRSLIQGRFTLADTKALEIRHECQTTVATVGFGRASNFGTEVYTDVKIWKLK